MPRIHTPIADWLYASDLKAEADEWAFAEEASVFAAEMAHLLEELRAEQGEEYDEAWSIEA